MFLRNTGDRSQTYFAVSSFPVSNFPTSLLAAQCVQRYHPKSLLITNSPSPLSTLSSCPFLYSCAMSCLMKPPPNSSEKFLPHCVHHTSPNFSHIILVLHSPKLCQLEDCFRTHPQIPMRSQLFLRHFLTQAWSHWLTQGCYSKFGSNKERRKYCWQGKKDCWQGF